MSKVGVIGDLDSIIGFRALGMDVKAAANPEEVLSSLKKMVKEKYAIIFLTETEAEDLAVQDYIEKQRHLRTPAIILIPSARKKASIGKEQLRRSVRKATGIDLLSDLR